MLCWRSATWWDRSSKGSRDGFLDGGKPFCAPDPVSDDRDCVYEGDPGNEDTGPEAGFLGYSFDL